MNDYKHSPGISAPNAHKAPLADGIGIFEGDGERVEENAFSFLERDAMRPHILVGFRGIVLNAHG
jgi:hypothetical protein